MKTRPFRFLQALLLISILAVSLSFFAGCDSSSTGSSAGGSSESGEVVVGLTDAPGSFISYAVDVLSVSLTRQNGAVVETLPMTTTVDFAEYTDMTEFLTAATVPAGTYVAAALTLDYTNAGIYVENEAGDPVAAASIVDGDGDPVTTITIDLTFEERSRLVVAPGVPAHLTLDFDLASSNAVDFDESGEAEVTVLPSLTADINPEAPKIHRLRGPLKSVDSGEDRFTVVIRPFRHALRPGNEAFGRLSVTVDEETVYEINGRAYEGQAGLDALDALSPNTGVVVMGDLLFAPCRFEASEVRAGSSIPGGNMDVLTGNVVSRTNDTLTIKGGSVARSGDYAVLNKTITVLLGSETPVRRQFSAETAGPDAISVGQRISAFGDLSAPDTESPSLDATAGYIYMHLSTVRGTVVSADSVSADASRLEIDLQSVDCRNADIFDFASAGIDPAVLEIATGDLNLSGLDFEDPVKLRGFFTQGPDAGPDFDAKTLVSATDVQAVVVANWHPASQNTFSTISGDGVRLDVSGSGVFHHVIRGFVFTDLKVAETDLLIAPESGGSGFFSIVRRGGGAEIYRDFDFFSDSLFAWMEDGRAVFHLTAHGRYDAAANTLAAGRLRVNLD